ncbi:biotin--[acetyl-CoA-carboxylase] ligase [Tsukamurella sp. 8F]|uniref:biotin--[acetyl-CoA-carboxylase] ligase n=1 Tax=unclassified Tsukamurella TaxID=2633480 RepID=UPI0023B96701|nr:MULTISPECIES: biotin--[acetyl-CoA-carboxylase] ligase [unclassified Tsukamurella]MDF0529012.1 biotin--[acetyl-CoA-carboxylase] ligase [Tsukamurella sp. 8J]MDF0587385.1 biotin--[acetyl-CoA-carboxylase] ligase [Tsukamurella sp. 8F]
MSTLPDADAITAGVAGTRWNSVVVVPETGSTNDDLATGLRAGEEPGRVLIADLQTAGRGRHHRSWGAPAGSQLAISVSVAVPGTAAPRAGWLSLVMGTAAVAAVRAVAGLDAGLKWPNDLLLPDTAGRGGKTAGLLAELVVPVGGGDSTAVLGMGLNTTLAEPDLPVPTATSLALAGASTTDRDALAVAYLRALDAGLTRWAEDPAGTRDAYLGVCVTIGQDVNVSLPNGTVVTGTATGVDDEGRILVRAAGGETQALSAGDVTHLRPA